MFKFQKTKVIGLTRVPGMKLSIRTCFSNDLMTFSRVLHESTVKASVIFWFSNGSICFCHYDLVTHKFQCRIRIRILIISSPYAVLSLHRGIEIFGPFYCCFNHLIILSFTLLKKLCSSENPPFLPHHLKGKADSYYRFGRPWNPDSTSEKFNWWTSQFTRRLSFTGFDGGTGRYWVPLPPSNLISEWLLIVFST